MPRGGARPGAGRKPGNVIPFSPGPRPTFGAAFGAAAPAAVIAPAGSPANRLFSELAGDVGANIAVVVFTEQLEKKRYPDGTRLQVQAPDDEDVDKCAEQTAEAIRIGLGDAIVPWWAGLLLAYGNLYLGMRATAERVPADERTKTESIAAAAAAEAEAETPIGRQRPPAPARPSSPGWQPLEPVRRTGST